MLSPTRVTAPRIIVPGATTAVTRRTTFRKAFLAPWHPGVEQAWLYCLANAQRHTGVAIHHATRVVTHHHLTITPELDNAPSFLRLFHGECSKAVNTLLAHEHYDQPGDLFDKRSSHMMRLCDAGAQSSQLVYEYLNTTAAGLVDRPEHMPGFVFDFELWLRGHIDVRRPDFYFSDKSPEVLRLHVTPPPLLFATFDGDLQALVHHLKRLADHALRELRAARNREPLGARRLLRMHPWSEPRTLRERRGTRVPTFRIGARGLVGWQQHVQAATEVRDFRLCHRDARRARADGDLDAVFPYGTYQMKVEHGAPVAAAPEVGIVTRPGPLLRDIQAQLEAEREAGLLGDPERKQRRIELVNEVRQVFADEASDLCEHAAQCMDFDWSRSLRGASRSNATTTTTTDDAPPPGDDADDDSEPVITRHRFSRQQGKGPRSRRVITLRDRRMGRPPKTRHGTDPPD